MNVTITERDPGIKIALAGPGADSPFPLIATYQAANAGDLNVKVTERDAGIKITLAVVDPGAPAPIIATPPGDAVPQVDVRIAQADPGIKVVLGVPGAGPIGGAITTSQISDWAAAVAAIDQAAAVTYANPGYPSLSTVQQALDQILYVAPAITSFSNSVGAVEIGSTVNAVLLTWSVNKTMTTLTLDGASLTPSLTQKSLTGLNLTTTKSWTLAAGDGTNTASRTSTVSFQAKRWWGLSAAAALASDDILALGNSEFATGRGQSKTFNAAGQYIYFAWPTSFGIPAFVVGGLASSGWVQATVTHINQSGFTQDYFTFRSQFLQNGSGIVVAVS